MATLSLSSLLAIRSITTHKANHHSLSSSSSQTLSFRNLSLRSRGAWIAPAKQNKPPRRVRSAEEEAVVPEQEETAQVEGEGEAASSSEQQAVSVPVSPSDTLTMFFQADGTMSEAAIPVVTSSLEELEGIANLKVQVIEGIATVELTKQTTVQATGVASSLVETIQGSGFKLQTLNLSFEDEESLVV
ncbi:hypothetical protein UlMin_014933 [Ulmus minor]